MLFVTTLDELAGYPGAHQLEAYREQHGFAGYAFLYANVCQQDGQEAIHATFHKVAAGISRGTLNVSAVRESNLWRCHHLEDLAPAL
jgi:hypothetical protein